MVMVVVGHSSLQDNSSLQFTLSNTNANSAAVSKTISRSRLELSLFSNKFPRHLMHVKSTKHWSLNRAIQVTRIVGKKKCRCHGPTASCPLKTCWRELINFTEIGVIFQERYNQALQVKYVDGRIVRNDTGATVPRGRQGNLAFYDPSPDYCLPDRATGFPGMRGRKCVHGEISAVQCDRMCTACKHEPHRDVEVRTHQCRCSFEWCCRIKCETCENTNNITLCQ